MPPKTVNTKENALNRLVTNSVILSNGCVEWRHTKNNDGYGYIRIDNKIHRTHQLSYRLFVGDIPKDKIVCHACNNPSCINPNHLYLGTQADNMQDRSRRGTVRRGAVVKGREYKQIVNWLKDGVPQNIIAKRLGRSRHTISRINKLMEAT
jgi:hypothetical protein